ELKRLVSVRELILLRLCSPQWQPRCHQHLSPELWRHGIRINAEDLARDVENRLPAATSLCTQLTPKLAVVRQEFSFDHASREFLRFFQGFASLQTLLDSLR